MIWLRNTVVYLLSSLLFIALFATVLATTINVVLDNPGKVETWLDQSGVYTGFVNTAVNRAKTSSGDSSGGGISLSDAAVQQAAQAAFSTSVLKLDVNKFLDGNYAWLQGKVAKPNFVIDLSGSKQLFAKQVGQYVTAHLASLPICTYAQSLNYQNIDPLTATCKPSNISAASEGSKITEKLSGATFIENPVITAETFGNSATSGKNQPYYEKFSVAPKIYQWATKAPLILGAISVVSALGVVFISRNKRKGLRRVATTLAFAGIIFIASKFVLDAVTKTVEKSLFKNSNIADMQQSLTTFINLVESEITKIYLYFGISFVIIAAVIIFSKIIFKDKSGRIKALRDKLSAGDDKLASSTSEVTSNTPPTDAKPVKKPRLIQ